MVMFETHAFASSDHWQSCERRVVSCACVKWSLSFNALALSERSLKVIVSFTFSESAISIRP